MGFKEKLQRTLQHEIETNLKHTKEESCNLPIKINTGSLCFDGEEYEETKSFYKKSSIGTINLFPYYSLTISKGKSKLYSVTFCGHNLLSNLNIIESVSPITFYNVKDVIYTNVSRLENIFEIKRMFSWAKLQFKDWNKEFYNIVENRKTEILFYNGVEFFTLVTTQIIFFEEKNLEFMRQTTFKKTKNECGICKNKEHSLIIVENPIIPLKNNRVCEDCVLVLQRTRTH